MEPQENLPSTEWVNALPFAQIPAVQAQLASLALALAARQIADAQKPVSDSKPRWSLTIEDVERRTGLKRRWLIQHATQLPFLNRFSKKNFRADETLLNDWLEQQRAGSRRSARV
jgi:hypothetical protein